MSSRFNFSEMGDVGVQLFAISAVMAYARKAFSFSLEESYSKRITKSALLFDGDMR